MKINIKYFAQIKKEAGKPSDILEVPSGASLQECIRKIGDSNTASFKNMLFDESGAYRDTIVLMVNSIQVRYAENPVMHDGDELMLMSPIAGG